VSEGAWIVVGVLAAATAFGLFRAATDGRFRGTHRVKAAALDQTASSTAPSSAEPARVLTPTDIGHELGERATLVQFSSAFCAPCRAARRTLGEVAAVVPGVEHVEIDAEHHLELVRRVGVMRTPTTLVLDDAGREVTRATGAPRKEAVLSALSQALPD
jgi:thiol-disulfide isomerase/thioredoxin